MKRIVICCDGTWNKPGSMDRGVTVKTNVQRMYEAVDRQDDQQTGQVKFYGQGVGTSLSLTDRILGGTTGKGIDQHIKDAYKFIMWNYRPGDQLYFFGFSRGAYTARSLVGWIRNCGIMRPDVLHIVDESFRLYRDRSSLTHPDSDLMISFRRQYGHPQEPDPKIRFIGVWDTVGALGIPLPWFRWLNRKHEFHDVRLSSKVEYAYHALAADERRKLFSPSIWELSDSVKNGMEKQTVEQVWFPGAHSNVGGGYARTGLSDQAFVWMMQKAAATGLKLKEDYVAQKIKEDCTDEIRNSAYESFYKFLPKAWRQISPGGRRKVRDDITDEEQEVEIVTNESIHYSCFRRHHAVPDYRPKSIYQAITRANKPPFDPAVEAWQEDWREYLNGIPRKDTLRHRLLFWK